jgi:interferon gamma-inducible protein 30
MKLLLIITLLSFASSVFSKDERVKITVYYESYCPDSARFLNGQLTRAFTEVRNITNIELVPFGKASVCKLIIK